MEKEEMDLFYNVLNGDYCIGCGNCAGIIDSPISMSIDDNGKYKPVIGSNISVKLLKEIEFVCPFINSEFNEDILGNKLYSKVSNIKHSSNIGYYSDIYAGHVKIGNFRENGSSGGMGTWITERLLEAKMVDYIIHVKPSKSNSLLFEYGISKNKIELFEGAKSKYYPIELSNIINFVRNNEGRYALVGIPCFIKAIRLMSEKDYIIKERIIFTVGLVCGHLKSDYFAKFIGWEAGIVPNNMTNIDFRVKDIFNSANKYKIKVKGIVNGENFELTSKSNDFFVTNWGEGHFKYKACDYCDDVVAETADITIGDAWLSDYIEDGKGTNIIIVRNEKIAELIKENMESLYLDKITESMVYSSQAAGFRHRRQGLAYRLYIDDKYHIWRPIKRIKPSNKIKNKRKKVYLARQKLRDKSFESAKNSIIKKDFNIFKKNMQPYIYKYNKNIKLSFFAKVIRRLKSLF